MLIKDKNPLLVRLINVRILHSRQRNVNKNKNTWNDTLHTDTRISVSLILKENKIRKIIE